MPNIGDEVGAIVFCNWKKIHAPRHGGACGAGMCSELRRFAAVEFEQAAEALLALDRFGAAHRGWPVARPGVGRWLRKEQSIVFALMGSFVMVMLDIFRDGVLEGGLAEEDHAVEALGFDRLDEPLGERVQIRAARRQGEWFDAGASENHVESGGEFTVTVADQIPASGQQITSSAGEVASPLAHPRIVGIGGDAGEIFDFRPQCLIDVSRNRRQQRFPSHSRFSQSSRASCNFLRFCARTR
jgi:hypothetical protein